MLSILVTPSQKFTSLSWRTLLELPSGSLHSNPANLSELGVATVTGFVQSVVNLTEGTVDSVLPASKAEFHRTNNQLKQAETELAALTTENQQLQITVTNLVEKVNSLTPVRHMHTCAGFVALWAVAVLLCIWDTVRICNANLNRDSMEQTECQASMDSMAQPVRLLAPSVTISSMLKLEGLFWNIWYYACDPQVRCPTAQDCCHDACRSPWEHWQVLLLLDSILLPSCC